MIRLDEVLYGIQSEPERRLPPIPAHLEQVVFSEAVIDSRLATPGCLFVALRGERVDGHQFLNDAAARGARAALVRHAALADIVLNQPAQPIDPVSGAGLEQATAQTLLLIAVDDPLAALQRLAAYHRSRFTPRVVVGITGSVGKSSTKEAIAAVLSRGCCTLKTPKSYNSEATVPIVLLQLDADHEAAVLEMGMYGPGEIALLASLARPQIGVVTNVGPSHLERIGSIEAIAAAKSELPQALPSDGYAVLNIDDPRVRAMAELTPASPFFYGLDPAAHLWADQIESRGLEGIAFRVHYGGEEIFMRLPMIGRHSVHTALAATAVGLLSGLGWDAIISGLRDDQAQIRLMVVPGEQGITLIDDTYNASPASGLAALNLLAELDGRKIAVLGDMLELGSAEEEAHRTIGTRAADVADVIVTVGERARWIAAEALVCGKPHEVVCIAGSNAEALEFLRGQIQPGDYVLIKGSRGMAMEAIVTALQTP